VLSLGAEKMSHICRSLTAPLQENMAVQERSNMTFSNLTKGIAIIFLAAFGFSRITQAQATLAFTDPDANGAATAADGSMKVGWFLESEFTPYFKNCTGALMKKKQATVSSVPVPVISALGLRVSDWVIQPRKYTVANAFAIIFPTENLPDTDVIDPKSQLGMNVLGDPAAMLPQGVSKVIYSSNCTAILGAAAGVDSKISFPLASLSAAVKADYQSNNAGELGLIVGIFNSPFLQLYNNLQGHDGAVFAHLLVWDWYRNKYSTLALVPSEKYSVLSWFNGISLYRIDKESRQTDGSVNMSGSASYAGLVSVTGSLNAQYKKYGAINVTNYKFAPFASKKSSPPSTYGFQQLASVDEIVTWAKEGVFSTLDPKSFSTNNVLRQGYPEMHSQIIKGVPQALCDHHLWTANPSVFPKAGSLSVTGESVIAVTETQPVPACSLTLTFKPDDSLFSGASSGNVDLFYSLDTRIADKTFEVTAEKVPLQTSSFPLITPSSVGPISFVAPTAATGGFVLTWDLKAVVQDDPSNLIDTSAVITTVAGPTFDGCNSGTQKPLILPNGIVLDSKHQLSISVQEYIATATKPDPSAKDNVSCSVNLTLQFKTVTGHFVNRALPSTQVTFPNLVPPPKFQLMQ
jgi:hypothetical protein